MNIVILNDYAHVNGGAGMVAISSAIALAKKGYQVILFAGVSPIDNNLLNINKLQVICLNQYDILNNPNRLKAGLSGLWNFSAASKFKKLLKKLDKKNTIIHIHACSKSLSASCIYIANKLGFNILYHMHGYGLACPNLGFYNYQKKSICQLKPLTGRCLISNCDSRKYTHKLWRVLRHIIYQKVIGLPNKTNHFLAISDFSLNILKKFLPTTSTVHFVPNPIDVSKQNLVDVSKNKYFTFAGRLTPEKNPVLLARAAVDLNLPTVFLGEGPEKNEILRIYPNAKMTGWLKHFETQEYLRKSRVLIFPSLWYEVQPLIVIEAAALGIPAIVADTCSSRDFIIDNVTGLIFKSNDLEDLKNKLILTQNDEFVKKLGENAYNHFWNNPLSMDKYIDNILNVYSKMIH
jgi:glycosyltransferase involved in cell wall biosynthesis